jgi:hypothetical protein
MLGAGSSLRSDGGVPTLCCCGRDWASDARCEPEWSSELVLDLPLASARDGGEATSGSGMRTGPDVGPGAGAGVGTTPLSRRACGEPDSPLSCDVCLPLGSMLSEGFNRTKSFNPVVVKYSTATDIEPYFNQNRKNIIIIW